MFPPAKSQEESKNPSTHGRDLRSTLLKDRAYVHFADDDFGLSNADPNLKYADEISAYTAISTRGHFTPNPRMIDYNGTPSDQHRNSHVQSNALDEPKQNLSIGEERRSLSSARPYELSPSRKRPQPSPKQSQGRLADKIGKADANSSSEDKSQRIHINRANLVCE